MKLAIIASLFLLASSSFAGTSIDKCVDDALEGARLSLSKSEGIDARKLFIEESSLLIEDNADYLALRKGLELHCRRLFIATVDIGDVE